MRWLKRKRRFQFLDCNPRRSWRIDLGPGPERRKAGGQANEREKGAVEGAQSCCRTWAVRSLAAEASLEPAAGPGAWVPEGLPLGNDRPAQESSRGHLRSPMETSIESSLPRIPIHGDRVSSPPASGVLARGSTLGHRLPTGIPAVALSGTLRPHLQRRDRGGIAPPSPAAGNRIQHPCPRVCQTFGPDRIRPGLGKSRSSMLKALLGLDPSRSHRLVMKPQPSCRVPTGKAPCRLDGQTGFSGPPISSTVNSTAATQRHKSNQTSAQAAPTSSTERRASLLFCICNKPNLRRSDSDDLGHRNEHRPLRESQLAMAIKYPCSDPVQNEAHESQRISIQIDRSAQY